MSRFGRRPGLLHDMDACAAAVRWLHRVDHCPVIKLSASGGGLVLLQQGWPHHSLRCCWQGKKL